MEIIEKNPNKVKVEIETSEYKKNFDSKMIQENEIDIEEDNILSEYNPVEALAAETEKPK